MKTLTIVLLLIGFAANAENSALENLVLATERPASIHFNNQDLKIGGLPLYIGGTALKAENDPREWSIVTALCRGLNYRQAIDYSAVTLDVSEIKGVFRNFNYVKLADATKFGGDWKSLSTVELDTLGHYGVRQLTSLDCK